MTPLFKFLHRVRIHGGECGAVARALHHKAEINSLPAVSENVSFTTNERKQMSTKTTLKRIALVAVSALGFGVLQIAVPAASNAAGATPTSIVIGAVPTARVGVTSYVPFKVYLPSTIGASDTINISAEVTSAPLLGGTANGASALGGDPTDAQDEDNDTDISSASTTVELMSLTDSATTVSQFTSVTTENGRTGAARSSGVVSGAGTTGTGTLFVASHVPAYDPSAAEVTQGYVQGYIAIKPDVAGSYNVLVSATNNGAAYGLARTATVAELYNAGDISATFTISTAGSPTSVTLTTVGGGTLIAGSPRGTAIAVKTVGGVLGANDTFEITTSGGTGRVGVWNWSTGAPDTPSGYATAKTLTSSDFNNDTAIIFLRDAGTAAATVTVTVTGGGALSSSVSANKAYTVRDDAGSATAMTYQAPATTATYAMTNATEATDTITVTELSTSQKIGFTFTDYDATKYGYVTVTDTAGKITGVATLPYDVVFSAADGDEGLAVSFAAASSAATGTLFTVAIPAAATTTLGVASAVTKTFASAARTNSTFSITPNSTFIAAPAAAIALTATLKDQFGAARSGQTVTITTSGRNNPTATTAVTDASGKVTFTTADTSTSTTALTDTVTFAASGATSSSVTINYGNTAVGTLTVTGGDTTDSVISLTKTNKDIAAGTAGASAAAGLHTVTATVSDANGNALAGIKVTWTITGAGCGVLSTTKDGYTTSTGVDSASVYGWLAGTCTYTATAGGKTASGEITFAQATDTEARTISATVSGSVVTATVKDRYGNPIQGVNVYATKTGVGYFGSGLGRATGTTDKNGNLDFNITGGDADVTVSVVSYDATAGTTFGQTCALKGNSTCATADTAATAFTATTTGTATTAETGIGASYDAAGVASATVKVTGVNLAQIAAEAATDAAAEAIDAANAATDAANLAAEAADAATVAAEEARDAADAATAAVEELATQVATLMAALKAQITTLANTVAKIAKKVKA